MVSILPCQGKDAGSIPVTNSKRRINMWCPLCDIVELEPKEKPSLREQALYLLLTWAEECGFGYDNFPDEYERYKDDIKDKSYLEGMIYIAEKVIEEKNS